MYCGRKRIGLFRRLVLIVRSCYFMIRFFTVIFRSVELLSKPAAAPFQWPCYAESCLVIDSDDEDEPMDLS